MKSVAMVIAEKNFRDEEYQMPKEILEKAGIKVVTVSTTLKEVTGKLGLKVTPDELLENIDPKQHDAVIFIGGGGAEQYFDDERALNLAKAAAENKKIYGAICIAPVILANAGLLKNKKATVFSSEVSMIKEMGAIYTDEGVVIDGNLVTADGPASAKNFGEAIVNLLKK
ncbi:MAG: DJ-1/PfpI family protein [Alphaproteobacteria bacterium]|nr:MAG: DJ-1/PfpI family protein [Alphaproteobacteria bacterium]